MLTHLRYTDRLVLMLLRLVRTISRSKRLSLKWTLKPLRAILRFKLICRKCLTQTPASELYILSITVNVPFSNTIHLLSSFAHLHDDDVKLVEDVDPPHTSSFVWEEAPVDNCLNNSWADPAVHSYYAFLPKLDL